MKRIFKHFSIRKLPIQFTRVISMHNPSNPMDSDFLRSLDRKIDRLLNDVNFVKNRVSAYLGGGMGLTYLIDETPIYINTDDIGCPSNFLNGGRYEEDYIMVLASFRKPDSIFLDIGANLGVYSLRLAPMLRLGKVIAFEPNPVIRELLGRSIYLNGLSGHVQVYEYGASDRDALLRLIIPRGSAGGANVTESFAGEHGFDVHVRRLDDLLGSEFRFNIAKIDVEGHELQVLRGMQAILSRSPEATILFEKLNANFGNEPGLWEFFAGFGMRIYRVDGTRLELMTLPELQLSSAYFIATRESTVAGYYSRSFIDVYAADLNVIEGKIVDGALKTDGGARPGGLLFHGPYWYLPRGTYRLELDAVIAGSLTLTVAENFGYSVHDLTVSGSRLTFEFAVERDLMHFELVGRAVDGDTKVTLRRARLERLG